MNIISEIKAQDNTRKFLIELDDNLKVESVLITHKRTLCACVSTQVGCPVGCTFCATGKMGFSRNLSAEEIVGQISLMQSVTEQKITNIVFMGMGEPLLNYDNVVKAVNDLRKQSYSWQKITVSTVGIPDKIRQLGKDTQCQLAISLHAPNDVIRNKLVPINQKFPIKDVLDACKEFPFSRHGPLMIEYILIENVNDKLEHAKELAALLTPFKHIVINLIQCNPVVFSPPSVETAKAFKQCLIDAGYKTIIRTTKGVDIDAACGMLATKKILNAV
ncbi:MAG: 23S rRNA (adenine(2503)-C(2))-methyltransferase RlmN [Candidatus Woesearchaeota archaeon]|nr:23S rRNA (adenine(2503)-C(2))-methyltransferase RlmN [Candidatus Woesearchaeota archaeon]